MSENKQRSKNTPEECAVIAKAWAEGKTIQSRLNTEEQWIDRHFASQELAPSFGEVHYRVKPEPRTFEFWISTTGSIVGQVTRDSDPLEIGKIIEVGWTKIKAKEIV